MPLFYLVLTLIFSIHYFNLPDIISTLSSKAHLVCLSLYQAQSGWAHLHQALICGKKLGDPNFKLLFANLGIAHILVISGAHLTLIYFWILKILKPFRKKKVLSLTLLLIYVFFCNFSPSITRAYLFILVTTFNHRYKLFWPYSVQAFITFIICISLFPNWLLSPSLLLSLVCATLIQDLLFKSLTKNTHSSNNYSINNKRRTLLSTPLLKNMQLYLFLAPVLSYFQQLPSPLSIFINTFFAQYILTFLLATSFFVFIFPQIIFIFDPLYLKLITLLSSLNTHISPIYLKNKPSLTILWFYFFLILIIFYAFSIRKKRYQIKVS